MLIAMQDTTKVDFKPEPEKSNKSYISSNKPEALGNSPYLQPSGNLDVESQLVALRGESK